MTTERIKEIKKMNIGAPVDELLYEIDRMTKGLESMSKIYYGLPNDEAAQMLYIKSVEILTARSIKMECGCENGVHEPDCLEHPVNQSCICSETSSRNCPVHQGDGK